MGSRSRRDSGLRRRRRLLISACLTVSLLVIVLLSLSPAFTLRDVRVLGTRILDPDMVIETAAAPLGTPLIRVSEREVAERVAALPAVGRVTVQRRWPDRLDIAVTERTAVFGLGQGATAVLVDPVGATFPGPMPEGLIQGEGPVSDSAALAAAAQVVRALPPELHGDVDTLSFRSRDAVSIALTGQRQVFFGSSEDSELKGQVALSLIRGTRADRIDVSAPSRPTTR